MPELLSTRNRATLLLLIKYLGQNRKVRFRLLREQKFPEELAVTLRSKSEYLDSLASREFQDLQKKGWLMLDGSGEIEVLAEP
jgi:hypothetical protein